MRKTLQGTLATVAGLALVPGLLASASAATSATEPAPVAATETQTQMAPASSAEDRAVPLSQLGTGPDEYMNCGPTSAVNLLIARGKTPDGWTGKVSSRKTAVMRMRVGMNDDNKLGTTLKEIRRGLYAYGIKYSYQYASGSNMAAFDKALAAVRGNDDNVAILHGSANYWRSGPNMGHYVTIVGYNSSTGRYQMIDPATPQGSQGIRNVTKSQIYAFGAKRGLPNALWTRY